MAKIIGIDHITFAVRDLDQRMAAFRRVFGAKPLFQLAQGGATAIAFELGGKIINFVSEDMEGEGAFAVFLRESGEGLHHIGLAVDDLEDLKRVLQASHIEISSWKLESDQRERDEIYIEKGIFPASLQIVSWENNMAPSVDDWVSKIKTYSNDEQIIDLRPDFREDDSALKTRAKVIDLDHVCFGVKDREQTVAFAENILGCRALASGSRGGETSQTFMDIGGYIFNFVTAPLDGESFFADFLRKRGEDLHHIGFSIDNLNAFKDGMAANGINIPEWELEGDPNIRDEVLIGTRHSPTVLQMIKWADKPPSSVEQWMALEDLYTAGAH